MIMIDCLQQGRTINGAYYAGKLRQLRQEIARNEQCVIEAVNEFLGKDFLFCRDSKARTEMDQVHCLEVRLYIVNKWSNFIPW